MQALKYFRVLLTLVAATGATSVTAQTYPARPVTFIVPYAAGAGAISIETQELPVPRLPVTQIHGDV